MKAILSLVTILIVLLCAALLGFRHNRASRPHPAYVDWSKVTNVQVFSTNFTKYLVSYTFQLSNHSQGGNGNMTISIRDPLTESRIEETRRLISTNSAISNGPASIVFVNFIKLENE
jgi:uncharacterized protein YxeA